MAKSCSHERRINIYLKPLIFRMFVVDCYYHCRSESGYAGDIISKYYETMSEGRQKSLLAEFENVSEKLEINKREF